MIITERMEKWKAEAYPIVKRMIDKGDPESLLKLGSPEDEYDDISKAVTDAICRESLGGAKARRKTKAAILPVNHLANIITFAFHMDFCAWSDPINYHPYFKVMAIVLHLELVKAGLLSE